MRFIALSLFLLHAKFYAYWCKYDKVTASDKVGRFLETQCIAAGTAPTAAGSGYH